MCGKEYVYKTIRGTQNRKRTSRGFRSSSTVSWGRTKLTTMKRRRKEWQRVDSLITQRMIFAFYLGTEVQSVPKNKSVCTHLRPDFLNLIAHGKLVDKRSDQETAYWRDETCGSAHRKDSILDGTPNLTKHLNITVGKTSKNRWRAT